MGTRRRALTLSGIAIVLVALVAGCGAAARTDPEPTTNARRSSAPPANQDVPPADAAALRDGNARFAGRLLAPAHLPQEQAQRAGHIPTAANVPWSKAANDDGTFKSDDELKTIYTEAGVDWSKDTIAYCRIGERSSHTWFVLKELLGEENVKNYDGSWTEYGSLVGVPDVLGDEPGSL